MKRFLFAGLLALGFACTPRAAQADCAFEFSCSRHLSYVHTSKQRCLNYSSHSNPLPCAPGCGPAGPAMWNGLAAYGNAGYGYPAYGYPAYAAAPVAAAPATTPAPSTTSPSYQGPQPTPAPAAGNGLQQAGYFYYAPTANTGYGYGAGYGYGYGAGFLYYGNSAQAPNYWY